MVYCSWDMACDRCNCYFSFWTIFCTFTTLTSQKIKISKKQKKKARRYHYFTHVHQKLWLDDVWFLRYGVQWTDRQTDGQTDGKSDTYRWVPHLKKKLMKPCTTWFSYMMETSAAENNHLVQWNPSMNKLHMNKYTHICWNDHSVEWWKTA